MGVGALIFVFAHSSFFVVVAEFGLVLHGLCFVLLVPELALVAFFALVLEEVAAHSFSLQLEELLHLLLAADVQLKIGGLAQGGYNRLL